MLHPNLAHFNRFWVLSPTDLGNGTSSSQLDYKKELLLTDIVIVPDDIITNRNSTNRITRDPHHILLLYFD